jgi:hypothetical protein
MAPGVTQPTPGVFCVVRFQQLRQLGAMLTAMQRAFVAHAQLFAFTIRKFNGKPFVLNNEEFEMRHLVIAVVVAAGACFVGALALRPCRQMARRC